MFVVDQYSGPNVNIPLVQMTKMLDVLGDYLNLKKIKFCRLDGSMDFRDRQVSGV